jgi:putative flippase GtrA
MFNIARKLRSREETRFILVGIVNSLFGYFVGVGMYKIFIDSLSIFVIGVLSSSTSIIFSFYTQRKFVFCADGPWVMQLLRSFVVFGAVSLLGVVLLWHFVSVIGLSIWSAQGIVIAACAGLSFVGQKWFTFRHR